MREKGEGGHEAGAAEDSILAAIWWISKENSVPVFQEIFPNAVIAIGTACLSKEKDAQAILPETFA